MNFRTASNRKLGGKTLAGTIILSRSAIFLLLCFLTVSLGSEQQALADEPEGGRWAELGAGSATGGGISANDGYSQSPSLATGPGGTKIVAWADNEAGDSEIYVRRWNGAIWAEMGSGSASGGGISGNDGDSYSPSLAIAPDGTVVVAWADESEDDVEIYVRRWNGAAWVEMGSGSASGGGISDNDGDSWSPSLALGPDGMPIVAWDDESKDDGEIYVRRWNGSSWVEMGSGSASGGGISMNSGFSAYPSLAVNSYGTPIIAWEDDTGGDADIYIRRWNGSSWVVMGANSASGGGISDNNGDSWSPSLAAGPAGTTIVAWEDDTSGAGEIYVRRWNDTSWVEMGANSASGGGISSNGGISASPSLAIGPEDMPVIAWDDDTSGDAEIYVRRWNGSSWVEMGSGSASGGGISGNEGDSWLPSLAIGSDSMPIVAWEDNLSFDAEIYVRQWQLTIDSAIYMPVILR